MNLFDTIRDILNPPERDPMRFANAVAYVPNFHGELIGDKRKSNVNDRVKIDDQGHVSFTDKDPFAGIEIQSTLTDSDIKWLRFKRLDPTNIVYQKAKAHFAKNPTCGKDELAQVSGMGVETAKDVLAGFRKGLDNHV